MPMDEVNALCEQFVAQLSPTRVYLFGSYANGTAHDQSDLDFYIIMKDGTENLADLTAEAYRAIRHIKRGPVDIIVSTVSRSIERKEPHNGVLLYDQSKAEKRD